MPAPREDVILRVDRLSYGGRGVARLDGLVVFVDGAAPGEVVRARLRRMRKTYAEATTVGVEEPSPARVPPRCPHFGECGGCLWQHVDYPAQLAAKEAIVVDSLRHLGGLTDLPVRPILPTEPPWHYRNKMEFSLAPPGRVGLHRRERWDEVVDLEVCYLPSPRVVAVLQATREFLRAWAIPCYDPRTHQGFARHLVVREGRATGEMLVGLVTTPGPFPQAREWLEAVRRAVPDVTGVVRVLNPSRSDAVEVAGVEVLAGRPFIHERLRGLTFRLDVQTFFQTNTAAAERMLDVVVEFAALSGRERVADLYCGVGTFALALASRAAEVVGVEAAPAAVDAARHNAASNGIANARFVCADAARLPEIVSGAPPDVVVLDPPRAGAGARVMRRIAALGPPRVVYVSCNPTTLAPDLRVLVAAGYRASVVQPLDLFPHTYHVECIVRLDRSP
ncbi:MAG: 23S rRNA (uracil(1939)-C(5))-methyltransferase RlmD [Armatimonadota bacterium]|nr:23S rRNA (uracil(1939)-C(5))-methyltransferase RlmD [Armatimonadota bacterium]